MGLRNIPTDAPVQFASLVAARKGTVASRSLTRGGDGSMTLLAFAPGESVSEEIYPQDVMYYLLEGSAIITLPSGNVDMRAGDVLCVPAGVPSAVEGASPSAGFKLLQVAVPTNE